MNREVAWFILGTLGIVLVLCLMPAMIILKLGMDHFWNAIIVSAVGYVGTIALFATLHADKDKEDRFRFRTWMCLTWGCLIFIVIYGQVQGMGLY